MWSAQVSLQPNSTAALAVAACCCRCQHYHTSSWSSCCCCSSYCIMYCDLCRNMRDNVVVQSEAYLSVTCVSTCAFHMCDMHRCFSILFLKAAKLHSRSRGGSMSLLPLQPLVQQAPICPSGSAATVVTYVITRAVTWTIKCVASFMNNVCVLHMLYAQVLFYSIPEGRQASQQLWGWQHVAASPGTWATSHWH